MKKRGFTLVEVIAVIAILAVILILAIPKINDYVLSNKKKTFANNALNIARQLEYDNMDFMTFQKAYLKDFDLKGINKNDIDLEKSLVYTQDNEVYIDLIGKGQYEGFYACNVGSSTKNVVVRDTACGTSTDGLIYIDFEVDLDGGETTQHYNSQYASGNYLNLQIPTKEEFTFNGWQLVNGNSVLSGNRIRFGTETTKIKAFWKAHPTLTVNNDGTTTQIFKEKYPGGTVIRLEKPIREGYTFAGWKVTSGNSIISGNTLTMGSEDTVITAIWKKSQAIYTESDNTLTFILSEHVYSSGETYNDKVIANVYTGFETSDYETELDVPWYSIKRNVKNVVFVDTISPISTAYWFYFFENCESLDVTKLDTSNVTNMSFMFRTTGESTSTFNIVGLNNWDTSNVTTMSNMFYSTGRYATTFNMGDLSSWDISNVTDMSDLFHSAGRFAATFNIGNLDNWNTANVVNMSNMFDSAGRTATTFNIGDLSGWNTSNVTNMNSMFYKTGLNATYSLNLSGWNVNKVTDYAGFNEGVTGKVTAPTWVN